MNGTERIERRLKLHDLRVLMCVVEAGSMSKAAQLLATSQPAVSRIVSDLEHSLGVRLLDRSPKGILPTPYGQALIRRSVVVFDELRLGVKDLEFLADPTLGEVRIAAPVALSGFAAETIDKLTRRHPRVVCHLMVEQPSRIFRGLEDRDVDLAISFLTQPAPEDNMERHFLYEAPPVVVASTKNPWCRRRNVTLPDLVDEPWTLPPPDGEFGGAFARMFRDAGLAIPATMVVAGSVVARLALVARGRYLTITSESAFRFEVQDRAIKALPIDLGDWRIPVGIITLRNRTLAPVSQLFIDCAREVAKPFAAKGSVSTRQGRPQTL